MSEEMTRKEVIWQLKGLLLGELRTTAKERKALEYAISSLETDEAYQLEYESTTKNDLVLIHTEGLDEGIRCAMCTNSMMSDRGCDGSCVVNNAMYKKVMDAIENHIVDTDKMVEPTTKNDLGVGCIDRKKLIDWINIWDITPIIKNPLIRHIQGMPSVTPQEPILDKIYADIQRLRGCSCSCSDGIIDDVENILDKYKAESEK